MVALRRDHGFPREPTGDKPPVALSLSLSVENLTMSWMPQGLSLALVALMSPATLAQERCCATYPAASAPLEVRFDGDSMPSLREIAAEYAHVTKQNLVFDVATGALLDSHSGGLQASIDVPPVEVQSFFEQLLAVNSLALQTVRADAPRVVRILPAEQINGGLVPTQAVPAESLAHWAKHPATHVTTTLVLQRADARHVANSLRAMVSDARTTSVMAPNSRTLIIKAFGGQAADFARSAMEADGTFQGVSGTPRIEIVRLSNAVAGHMAQVLERLFDQKEGAQDETGDYPLGPRIVVDGRTNTLILSGSEDTLTKMLEIVRSLDSHE